MNEFKEKLNAVGIEPTDTMIQQFARYEALLLEWNERMDLTAITEPSLIEERHFLESLSVLRLVPNPKGRWVDVGSGAGFPGIPLAIVRPELQLVLVDSLKKRVTFLEEVITELHLTQVTAIHARSEDLFRTGGVWRETFDGAVSRAVAPLSTLLEYVLPGVRVGGIFIAMKGSSIDQEIAVSNNALETLGGRVESIDRFQKDQEKDTDHFQRANLLIRKTNVTPERYPRRGDKARKKPL